MTTQALLGSLPRPAIRKLALPVAFLALGVALSVYSFIAVKHAVERDAQERFERQANDARQIFQTRLRSYIDVVYALKAAFDARGSLSRAEFHDFAKSLGLDRRYPGIEGLNFARHIRGEEKRALEAAVRRDTSLDPRGYPEFAVKPPGERPEHHVLIYLEPLQGNEFAFGLDIGVGAPQARAQAVARDTGVLTSSGRLIHPPGRLQFVALSVRLVVYRKGMPVETVAQRRAAFTGSVGAAFNVRTLFTGMLDETTMKALRYRLYDVGPATRALTPEDKPTLLFDSAQREARPPVDNAEVPNPSAHFNTKLSLRVAGRNWEAHLSAPKAEMVERADAYYPWAVLIGGLLSSGLLFAVLYSLASSRERAMALARAITRELTESEANLAQAQHMARLGRWTLNRNTGEMLLSTEAARILDLEASQGALEFARFLSWFTEQDRKRFEHSMDESASSGESRGAEYRLHLPRGGTAWAHFIFQPQRVAAAGVQLLRGTIMDITERKQVSLRLQVENQIAYLLSSGEDPETIVTRIIEATCTTFDWECGRFWRVETRDGMLHVANSWSAGQPAVAGFFTFGERTLSPDGNSVVARTYTRREPALIADLANDAGDRIQAALRAGLRASVVMPVHEPKRIYGVLEFFSGYPLHGDDTLLPFLQLICSQIGQFFERKQVEERLRFVAAHDALTNLPNRSSFSDALEHSMRRAARQRSGLALLFIDIDRFKLVNDTLGHNAGDLMLQECASRLISSLRDSDMVARLGGDEFVVLLESLNNSPTDATAVSRKILESLATPFMVENQEFQLSASIGICTYPEDGEDAGTLLKNADVAMYRAKEQGRNNYQFYAAQMNQHTFERLALESSLRRAVERGELLLHYQPKISMDTGQLSGMEALLRWSHPEMGMIAPTQFIPLAEETGLIVPIGEWVLREACRQCRAWQDEGLTPVRIAVNLSARQFSQTTLAQDIRRILAETGLRADCLELEITESMVMTQAENSIRILSELKKMGIHLSIDDFGTGYSSLAYLKRFPIDSIKIDRSFVRDLPDDPDDAAIARGIIALSHSLRLNVIAEGVETLEQRAFLTQNGCDEIQGYLISKPVSAVEAGALLQQYARAASPVEPRKLA